MKSGGGGAASPRRDISRNAPRAVPRVDLRRLKPELTPTWLGLATTLAGHLPSHGSGRWRAAYLGGGRGFTPAVVAAVHPDADVWWWDPDVSAVESARRLRDDAALTNLTVHEHPEPPCDIDGGPLDLVVIDGVLDTVDDEMREHVVDAATRALRPGGLLCVSYRTVVGWGEVAPVHRLVRHLVARDPRPLALSVPAALDAVERLRAGDAQYLTQRPVVDAWWRELQDLPGAAIEDHLVRRALRPVSHAQVAAALSDGGFTWIGPARPADLAGPDLEPKVDEIVGGFDSPLVREALTDLALRRDHRADLFRLGTRPLSTRERHQSLDVVRITGQGLIDPADPSLRRVVPIAIRRLLAAGTISVADLADRAADRELALRTLLARGVVHPVLSDVDDRATAAAHLLTTHTGRSPLPPGERVQVVPALGSALPASAPLTSDQRTSLGMR